MINTLGIMSESTLLIGQNLSETLLLPVLRVRYFEVVNETKESAVSD